MEESILNKLLFRNIKAIFSFKGKALFLQNLEKGTCLNF